MKKTNRKLTLARETLRHLSDDKLASAQGGLGTLICTIPSVRVCPSDDCWSKDKKNTCWITHCYAQ
jgi:hypothetical protein